jgi:hypothetical protein
MASTVGVGADRGGRLRLVHPALLIALAIALIAVMAYGMRARDLGQTARPDTAAAPGAPMAWLPAQGTSLPGIGRIDGMPLPCTGWLLDVGADPDSTAYAVTAGRCAGINDSGTVLSEETVSGATIAFRLLADAPDDASGRPVVVGIDDVAWASVRGTDLAVLALDSTYGELSDAGIPAIPVAAPLAPQGQLLVASVPIAGGADGSVLRGDRCQAGQSVDVAEGPWILHRVQASDCRGILTGSVGSPALDENGAAVGLVSTTTINSGAGSACEQRRPCQVESGMVSVSPDTTYLVDPSVVPTCFSGGELGFGGTCGLEDPARVVPADLGRSSAPAGSQVRVDLAADAGPTVGVRTGMLGGTDCWNELDWKTAAVDDGAATVRIPDEQGLAVVCVGSAAQPTPLRVTVTAAGPDPGLVELDQTTVTGGVQILPVLSPPALASVSWTLEPGTGADCTTVEGFVAASGTRPTFIPSSDLPATVCVIAADAAGNPSPPVAVPVGLPVARP